LKIIGKIAMTITTGNLPRLLQGSAKKNKKKLSGDSRSDTSGIRSYPKPDPSSKKRIGKKK
jgi:hypothetical protein